MQLLIFQRFSVSQMETIFLFRPPPTMLLTSSAWNCSSTLCTMRGNLPTIPQLALGILEDVKVNFNFRICFSSDSKHGRQHRQPFDNKHCNAFHTVKHPKALHRPTSDKSWFWATWRDFDQTLTDTRHPSSEVFSSVLHILAFIKSFLAEDCSNCPVQNI